MNRNYQDKVTANHSALGHRFLVIGCSCSRRMW